MKICLTSLFLLSIHMSIFAQSSKIWAVAVGIGSYKNASILSSLDGPVSQAYEFRSFVEETQFTDNEDVPILANAQATRQAILRTLERSFTDPGKVSANDMVIFYYSGHGTAMGKDIGICPYDYFDQQELISDQEIIEIMKRSPAKHKICIIEACKTETETMAAPLSTESKSYFNRKRNQIKEGLVYITSTQAGDPSYEMPEFAGGVFSYYFLRAIKGAADRNGNLIITSQELFDYLKEKVATKTGQQQIPQINEEGYRLNIPVIALAAGKVKTTKKPRNNQTDLLTGFVRIKGGSFQMGNMFKKEGGKDELPVHDISLSSFYLSIHELSFLEFDLFCEATGRDKPNDEEWGRAHRPVINVSWYDAIEYCNWRSLQEGLQEVYQIDKLTKDYFNVGSDRDSAKWTVKANWSADGYRLPTEAEWEYAARQRGLQVRFGNGQDIADPFEMNFRYDSYSSRNSYTRDGVYQNQPLPVGLYVPNSLGLFDMSGNVQEWCWDWYGSDQYQRSASHNPTGARGGRARVVRGGAWYDTAPTCRVANRERESPIFRDSQTGFRLARNYRQ
ncbi:MAG: SUMF1/EgtB/PvdO family nonheme iron enzyme [Bacteroidota bacterium]